MSVEFSTYGGSGDIFAELVRLASGADEGLRSVAMEMKSVNDRMAKLRAVEQKIRDITGDERVDPGEIVALDEAIDESGFKSELTAGMDALHAYSASGVEYKPYSTDPELQSKAKVIDRLKETLSSLK